ncbi:hypothetical protein LOK49_LG09G02631 [Camellia lanceoleosa]|uniref:Uncharacterized protein n=1 Tax=Camellia lanceoleosa TaxID=1840588 RepID=A0ACC0GIW3_9ERIC|nr:hypothetical protein LOK49_LG09G02631 [Camellia lanceoleosa]
MTTTAASMAPPPPPQPPNPNPNPHQSPSPPPPRNQPIKPRKSSLVSPMTKKPTHQSLIVPPNPHLPLLASTNPPPLLLLRLTRSLLPRTASHLLLPLSSPMSSPKPAPIGGILKEIDELDDDEEGIEKRGNFEREKDDATARLGSIGLGKGRDSSGSLIPDQATINAIRAKRERLSK